jgi:N-acetylglucosaminyl-diphospho-decaprenol L-rhamnosyltransferase
VSAPENRVAVVIATRNRASELLAARGHLRALPERPKVVVMHNASSNGALDAVRCFHPEVESSP